MYSYIKFNKKKCKTGGVKEVNRIIPAGATAHQADEGREATHRIPEV